MRNYLLLGVFAVLMTSCTPGRDANSTPPPASAARKVLSSAISVQVTDANYEDVVRSHKVILLFFWAEWSAPDRAMMPTIDHIATEYLGRVTIGKVNVDDNPNVVQKFGIKGIPALVVLKDGSEQDRVVSLAPKKKITGLLDKQL